MSEKKELTAVEIAQIQLRRNFLNMLPAEMTKSAATKELTAVFEIRKLEESFTTTANSKQAEIDYIMAAPASVYDAEQKAKMIADLKKKQESVVDAVKLNGKLKEFGLVFQTDRVTADGSKLPNRYYPVDLRMVKRGRAGIARITTSIDEQESEEKTVFQLLTGLKRAIVIWKCSGLRSLWKFYTFSNGTWKEMSNKDYGIAKKEMDKIAYTYLKDTFNTKVILGIEKAAGEPAPTA